MTINTMNKQLLLADFLEARKVLFSLDFWNDYEFAGKILAALEEIETEQLQPFPAFYTHEEPERPGSWSEEYINAH
jgi:hypothetical protein